MNLSNLMVMGRRVYVKGKKRMLKENHLPKGQRRKKGIKLV